LDTRRFLFLQGVSSPFFVKLGSQLTDSGHEVLKLNFNAGDVAFSAGMNSQSFIKKIEELPEFLSSFYQHYEITDQVLFGDRRPIHVVAITQARKQGIKNHIFEEGYFRPHWITLEREGVNSRSLLPRSVDWLSIASEHLAANPPREYSFHSPFWRRAWHDVHYHSAGAANAFLFPHYRTHSNVIAPVEYAGYLKRFSKIRVLKKYETLAIEELVIKKSPYFFLPLQLNSDSQVRDQHTLNTMTRLIAHVMRSFAEHAKSNIFLVIKNHPLDIGLVNYSKLIRTLENQFGLKGRIRFFESGDLDTLVRHAKGVVTLNSTVGLVSLAHACPTIALGEAIYDLTGLTDQTELDAFWTQAARPDMDLYQKFKSVLLNTTQINGGFYCPRGIELAVKGSVVVLAADKSPLENLLERVNQ
jgi:capsular polysaccharide export protein